MYWIQALVLVTCVANLVPAQDMEFSFKKTSLAGLGPQEGVMRRDPSDIIKAGDLYYIWYTRGSTGASHGYDATVWCATSPDGLDWTEQGEALARGGTGHWDEQSVFTPNILAAEGKFWLFYTGVPKPFTNDGNKVTKSAIGIAVSGSPAGPWKKLETNPILKTSENPQKFDSMRVDDSCLLFRDGKYWLYYKGRKWDDTWRNTKLGVALADRPQGPYLKHAANPLIQGGHEVLMWPRGEGVVAMINLGPKGIAKSLQFSENGISFGKILDLKDVPFAPGAYRPEAFTDSDTGEMIKWGVHIGRKEGSLPFLERFDCKWKKNEGDNNEIKKGYQEGIQREGKTGRRLPSEEYRER